MSRLSRRSLSARLEATRVDVPLNDAFADDLAARLKSLAVAASFEAGAKKGRLRRKFVAVIGSMGVIGWIGVTGAAASVGLATTGNLPAPIQRVVSSVFDVVGIDIPSSDENVPAPVDDSVPVETTVPPTDDDVDPDTTAGQVAVPSSRPGNSGSTPAATAPGPPNDNGRGNQP